MLSLASLHDARSLVDEHVHRTPLLSAARLGSPGGVRLSLKCENLQKTGSFKARGALNRLLTLPDEARRRGVVTVSAGNHAQALAWAAAQVGVRATVVMPEHASRAKVDASRGYGAEVVLHGTPADAFVRARELAAENGLAFVHPFDDPAIVAGAGTAGLELVEQMDDIDAVVVPVGGGGLISGIAIAVRARSPRTRIVGVEPEGAAAMRRSLDAGSPQRLDEVRTIADGLAAPMAGELNFRIVRELVDDVVLVSDAEIGAAVSAIAASAKLVAEPAGAAGVAAVLARRIGARDGARVVAVVSGGNVDAAVLRGLL